RMPRFAKWAVGSTLLLCGTAYLAISLFAADILTRPNNRILGVDPRKISSDVTSWSTRTSDGLTLRGWYFPTEERRHLIVLIHGMGESRLEMATLGRDLHACNYDILMFDLRGHGQSDPSRLFMGRRERGDLRAVLSWARDEGFSQDRIGWLGYSMGASTLLMEAAQNPNIRVAVVDSPYGSLPELLYAQLSRHSHLPRWFNPGILTAARFAFGVRTDDLVPIRSARRWGHRPLLLIHGEADSIVPVSQAYQLAQAAGSTCRSVTLPGVEHVHAYREDPERYVAAVDSFFNQHLTP
ncbi:alpha/beta hydrolase, partial [Singulisphaera rosea]